jgi:hypothetical protein
MQSKLLKALNSGSCEAWMAMSMGQAQWQAPGQAQQWALGQAQWQALGQAWWQAWWCCVPMSCTPMMTSQLLLCNHMEIQDTSNPRIKSQDFHIHINQLHSAVQV